MFVHFFTHLIISSSLTMTNCLLTIQLFIYSFINLHIHLFAIFNSFAHFSIYPSIHSSYNSYPLSLWDDSSIHPSIHFTATTIPSFTSQEEEEIGSAISQIIEGQSYINQKERHLRLMEKSLQTNHMEPVSFYNSNSSLIQLFLQFELFVIHFLTIWASFTSDPIKHGSRMFQTFL